MEAVGLDDLAAEAIEIIRRLIVAAISEGGSLDPAQVTSPTGSVEVQIRPANFSPQIVAARLTYARQATVARDALCPRLDALFEHLEGMLGELCKAHGSVLEISDLDPLGDSRAGAAWRMSGQCLALAIAAVRVTRAGVGNAGAGILRAMHEANRLLAVFLDQDEEAFLRRWLGDEDVRPEDARRTADEIANRDRERLIAAGAEIADADFHALSQEIYRTLSAGAHSRRTSVDNSYSAELRRFAYTMDDPTVIAGHAAGVVAMVEETVLEVSDALGRFLPEFSFSKDVKPQIEILHLLRAEVERR